MELGVVNYDTLMYGKSMYHGGTLCCFSRQFGKNRGPQRSAELLLKFAVKQKEDICITQFSKMSHCSSLHNVRHASCFWSIVLINQQIPHLYNEQIQQRVLQLDIWHVYGKIQNINASNNTQLMA